MDLCLVRLFVPEICLTDLAPPGWLASDVAHRDLKSANVLFDRGLMPKLCDFAFSKHSEKKAAVTAAPQLPRAGASLDTAVQTARPQPRSGSDGIVLPSPGLRVAPESDQLMGGQPVGTPQWMAPEVLSGEASTTVDLLAADVWSFGVIVWEILNRQHPYAGMSPHAVMWGVVEDGLKPTHEGFRGLSLSTHTSAPPFWTELCDECWAREPSERPTFNDIVKRLASQAQQAKDPPAGTAVVQAAVAAVSSGA
jgi:serine/threonine protein kinase